ncbi:TonB-dependent receptor plug [Flammeovirgaceae bacterium 311]|nr:TonB-dependent receptor plug [Flammeovirgaceae bacterium 311]
MRRVLFGLLFFLLSSANSWAQSCKINGQVVDAATGESLPGATVFINSLQGGVTDARGHFTFQELAAGPHQLQISFVGYQKQILSVLLKADTALSLKVKLLPVQEQLEALVIEASVEKTSYSSNLTSVTYLKPEDIQKSVGILGETDLIKTLQLKPGVQSGSEGNSGFYVRGGQSDQNLVLLDGVSIYNPSHLFGMFSVFNSDLLEDVSLYKGSFPARFGGRLSSVLDIGLKEGSLEEFKGSGGVGLISSRLTLEGPLVKDKLSLMVSGRRTYFDAITRSINKSMADDPDYQPIPDYYFYDLNAKLFFKPGKDDEFSFTFYQGNDKFYFNDKRFAFDFIWGNKAGILQWRHLFSERFNGKFSLSATKYDYQIRNNIENISQTAGSGIFDLNAAADFALEAGKGHYITFGAALSRHSFNLLRIQEQENADAVIKSSNSDKVPAYESAVYVSDEWEISDRVGVEGGLRLTGFSALHKNFVGLEPRMSLRWQAARRMALKASFSQAYQYVHLVNSSATSLPTSFWYPSNKDIRPQLATQYALGLDTRLSDTWKFSNELYYRDMLRQIDFDNGAEMYGNPNVTEDLIFGKGWAYGNEFYLEKVKGKTTGWIGYTLSWTWRKFDEINGGNPFMAAHDRRHDISIVARHQLSKRLEASITWVYGSGSLTTLPPGRFYVQGQQATLSKIVPLYTERNNFQIPAYHRMDAGLIYKLKPRWGEAELSLGVYNAYNRRNVYFMYFERLPQEKSKELKLVARQVSLFPVLPSVSFNYKF